MKLLWAILFSGFLAGCGDAPTRAECRAMACSFEDAPKSECWTAKYECSLEAIRADVDNAEAYEGCDCEDAAAARCELGELTASGADSCAVEHSKVCGTQSGSCSVSDPACRRSYCKMPEAWQ